MGTLKRTRCPKGYFKTYRWCNEGFGPFFSFFSFFSIESIDSCFPFDSSPVWALHYEAICLARSESEGSTSCFGRDDVAALMRSRKF